VPTVSLHIICHFRCVCQPSLLYQRTSSRSSASHFLV
jgi:hypothetical protein